MPVRTGPAIPRLTPALDVVDAEGSALRALGGCHHVSHLRKGTGVKADRRLGHNHASDSSTSLSLSV